MPNWHFMEWSDPYNHHRDPQSARIPDGGYVSSDLSLRPEERTLACIFFTGRVERGLFGFGTVTTAKRWWWWQKGGDNSSTVVVTAYRRRQKLGQSTRPMVLAAYMTDSVWSHRGNARSPRTLWIGSTTFLVEWQLARILDRGSDYIDVFLDASPGSSPTYIMASDCMGISSK